MINRGRALVSYPHVPLGWLALCLDCDECFGINAATCPACGSATWTPLSHFLEQPSFSRHGRREKQAVDTSKSYAIRHHEQLVALACPMAPAAAEG